MGEDKSIKKPKISITRRILSICLLGAFLCLGGFLYLFFSSSGNIKPESVTLSQDVISMKINTSYQLSADVYPSNSNNRVITWSSSDSSIVSVNNGKIKGLKEGNATITVTTLDGNKTSSSNVVVTKNTTSTVKVNNVSFVNKTVSINLGQEKTLEYLVSPNNASNKNVTFSSNNSSVVSINNSGRIKGLKVGSAVITITTVDGNRNDTCTVNVSNNVSVVSVTGVSLNKNSLSINQII